MELLFKEDVRRELARRKCPGKLFGCFSLAARKLALLTFKTLGLPLQHTKNVKYLKHANVPMRKEFSKFEAYSFKKEREEEEWTCSPENR